MDGYVCLSCVSIDWKLCIICQVIMFSICFAFNQSNTNNIIKILSVYRFFRNVSKVIYSKFFCFNFSVHACMRARV